MKWACGITTVPERRDTLLPQTVNSLARAGFSDPRIFMDDDTVLFDCQGRACTKRFPKVGNFGNWALGMFELHVRTPDADRYAMFEDDILACANLKAYLEACPHPPMSYLNLYTVAENEPEDKARGWRLSNQRGRGAVALVFGREALTALLQSSRFVLHPQNKWRGKHQVDGVVSDVMKACGRKEWVHHPSLVQHAGTMSTILTRRQHTQAEYMTAPSFPGENFNAMELLK